VSRDATARLRRLGCIALAALSAFVGEASIAGEQLRFAGTGSALGAARRLGEAFARENPDVQIEIFPSLGSAGGIRALLDGAVDVALMARHPSADERSRGLREDVCFSTPVVLVTSMHTRWSVALGAVARLFGDRMAAWPDGTKVSVILRPTVETSTHFMIENVPGMSSALATARARPDVPVATTDQENVELAQRISGSLAVSTFTQMRTESPNLRMLSIDNVAPDESFDGSGSYPLHMPICFALRATPKPAAREFVRFARSATASTVRRDAGLVLIDRGSD